MKANELRIGNIVQLDGEIGYVKSIYSKYFQVDDARCCSMGYSVKEKFEPVPLTEEWLIKFGFEKSKQPNGTIFYGNLSFGMRVTGHPYDDGFLLFGHESNVDIKYVHQLQNLYFALRGKELETKNIEL